MKIESLPAGLSLAGDVYIHSVETLVDALEEALDAGNPELQIDMSRVESIDTAVLQLFVSCRKAAEEMHTKLQLIEVSEPVKRVLKLSGLDAVFGW